ncbi:hypothetical protein AYP92_03760 [Lactobacillus crispatus]|uniref:Uncharacterized protein n=1 Tax=Lactobacillus crispatus TaxID=47770 RepID=A0A854PJ13_9LACO|nr:hypothetical protein [Lactobacillus crispatus]OXC22262.1 hypothetical protein AYP82_09470 [Lactobacillus crispatus]OXC30071.1 hypothetical protein AYP86_08270 [Lactobacillus crispatus]OXC40399.1 hypothetical protein AYP92_03760 [Lactobacillus crispatus]
MREKENKDTEFERTQYTKIDRERNEYLKQIFHENDIMNQLYTLREMESEGARQWTVILAQKLINEGVDTRE